MEKKIEATYKIEKKHWHQSLGRLQVENFRDQRAYNDDSKSNLWGKELTFNFGAEDNESACHDHVRD